MSTHDDFYDQLWSGSRLTAPERFNTWPLISSLVPQAPMRLELGAGLRPRLPIAGTYFVDRSRPAVDQLAAAGGMAQAGEISRLPFAPETFDLVGAFDVVEHVADDRQVLCQIARVLKRSGILILSVPLHPGHWTSFDVMAGHVRRYEPLCLRELLAACGFAVEASAVYGMQPPSPRLLELGTWFMKRHMRGALWWYNRLLLPLGMRFQKPLRLIGGLIDAPEVDEIIVVCRRTGTGPDPVCT